MFGPKFSWNEYFTGTPATTLVPGEYNSRQTPTGSSVYVLNCLFNKFTSGSYGGALYFTSATYLLIESSSFISCKTSSSQGGAVYFSNSGGQCVFHSVCGNDCCSTYSSGFSSGQFAYMSVNSGALSKNYFNYSSITRCVNENTNSEYNLNLNNGKICCPSTNISLNKCEYQPVIRCYPYKESNSVTCSITFCSFVDNNSTNDNCINFYATGAEYEIKSCNIFRNTVVVLSGRGTIYSNGNLMIKDSCILENKANYIFSQGYSSYKITLSNCTVDSTSNNGYLTIQNTVTKSFIHALNHMSTQNCHSGYDSAGSLTAIPLPTTKPQEKIIYCYTFKIIQYRAKVSDFFTFISLFIITFIHSDN
jgi:hypothetical protein